MNEFEENIKQHGLEYYNIYYGSYRGKVIDNRDPKSIGRLKIQVPQIHGEDYPDTWCEAKGVPTATNGGLWFLPLVGDMVWITFEGGDPRYPIWEYGHFVDSGEVPATARKKYKTYMLQSPLGQRIEFDDENHEMTISGFEGTLLRFNKDGRITIENGTESLKKLLKDFISEVNNLKILVTGTTGVVSPTSMTKLLALQTRLFKLLK